MISMKNLEEEVLALSREQKLNQCDIGWTQTTMQFALPRPFAQKYCLHTISPI